MGYTKNQLITQFFVNRNLTSSSFNDIPNLDQIKAAEQLTKQKQNLEDNLIRM
jgi:hypothetical protein